MGRCYEQYPLWIVFLSNLVSIATYALGGYIIYQLGPVWLALYLLYILLLEVRVMSGSCPNCYYFGRLCAFGKGRLSAIFFRKGNAQAFAQKQIAWKDILPDFLVSLIPLLAGIILLIMDFNFMIFSSVVLLAVLATAGSGFIRGSLACKHCRQREIGCPAEKLFRKANKTPSSS